MSVVSDVASCANKRGDRIKCLLGFLNTSRQKQNGRHFADDIFHFSFFELNLLHFESLAIVCNGPINNEPSLVQKKAQHRTGDKPTMA